MSDLEQQLSPHFKYRELMCPLKEVAILQEGFLEELEKLRVALKQPMIINSCCRSIDHNDAVGGAKNSFHLMVNPKYKINTCAIDLHTGGNTVYLHQVLKLALPAGWTAIIGKNYVHLDLREKYAAQPAIVSCY